MISKIYLAGPISGKNFDSSEGWRDYVKERIPKEILCYSPLRSKSFLRKYETIIDCYPENPLSTSRGIMTRDHFDCLKVDAILCNLLEAEIVSIGTVMEIAWSFAYRKPLVLCMQNKNIHNHPMIREAAGYIVDNLDDGIEIIKTVLLP